MRRTIQILVTVGAVVAATLDTAVAADAATVTSQASLVNGQLTIVGSGAVPDSNVSVDDSPTTGQADAQGNFTISASGFSEPSCVATLYDGSVSVEVTLSGCTPTISKPPAVPGTPTVVGPPSGTSTTEPMALSWQAPAGMPGVNFRWQVSTDPNFTTLALTATVAPKSTSTTLSGLAPGTYYWRVQAVSFPPEPLYFPLFGNWTPVSSLTITGEAAGTPGTPTVTSPDGTEFHPEETFPLTWTAVQLAGAQLPRPGRAEHRRGHGLVGHPALHRLQCRAAGQEPDHRRVHRGRRGPAQPHQRVQRHQRGQRGVRDRATHHAGPERRRDHHPGQQQPGRGDGSGAGGTPHSACRPSFRSPPTPPSATRSPTSTPIPRRRGRSAGCRAGRCTGACSASTSSVPRDRRHRRARSPSGRPRGRCPRRCWSSRRTGPR